MRLVSLYLKNIRSYVEETITFSESMLLVGDIGSGKSTILQAIEFGLFGIQRGLQDANNLLRKGEDSGEVRLTLFLDKEITIVRPLKRAKTSVSQAPGYIQIGNVKEELAPIELKTKMLELLSYPESYAKSHSLLYRYTVYATQEEMKTIILEKPETRLDTLRAIFGVDKYKQSISNAQIYIREIKKNIAFLEGKTLDLEEIQKERSEIYSRKETILKRKNELQTQINIEQKHLEEKKAELLKEEKLVKEQELLQEHIKNLEKNIQTFTKDAEKHIERKASLEKELLEIEKSIQTNNKNEGKNLEELKKTIDLKKELFERNLKILEQLEKTKDIIELELEHCKKEQDSLENIDESSLKEDMKTSYKRLEEYTKGIEKINESEKELSNKLIILNVEKSKIKTIEEEKHTITNMSSCSLCKQNVPHAHKEDILKEMNSKKELLLKKITKIEKEVLAAKQQSTFKESLMSKKEELLKNITKIEEKIKLNEKQQIAYRKAKEIEQELSLKKQKNLEKIKTITNNFNFTLERKEIHSLEQDLIEEMKISTLRQKKEYLKKNIKEYAENLDLLIQKKSETEKEREQKKALVNENYNESFLKVKKDFEEGTEKFYTIKNSLSLVEKEEMLLDKQIETLSKKIAEKEESNNKRLEYLQEKEWLLETFIPLQKDIETKVLSYIHFEFKNFFTKWLSLLLENDEFTATIDDDFSPKIQLQGFDIHIDALSGGERTSIALAYRLSLNHIVNTIIGLETRDILILDEPTEGFSNEQLDKVRDVIEQLDVSQLLIVSHEQKMAGFVKTTYKVEKEYSKSKVIEI